MKNLLSLIIVLLISFEVSAQIEQRISVLNKYAASQYSDVISDLLKIEQKEQGDFETKILLADSYYHLRDFKNALTWFEKATDINHL